MSRICAALDAEVATFRSRSLAGEHYPYLFLDATYVKVRDGGRVVSMAALVAVGVARTGERRILGLELAAGNDKGNAWAPFLRGLIERGLAGVRLVISDAHRGLVAAVRELLLGAAWQRCRVHFTRNAQALVPRSAAGMVASAIRSIFEQPDEQAASEQLRRVADGLAARFPAVAALSQGKADQQNRERRERGDAHTGGLAAAHRASSPPDRASRRRRPDGPGSRSRLKPTRQADPAPEAPTR